jgi:hypothetical protein
MNLRVISSFLVYMIAITLYVVGSVLQPESRESIVGTWEGNYGAGKVQLIISNDNNGIFYYLTDIDTPLNVLEGNIVLDYSKDIIQMSISNISDGSGSKKTLVSVIEPDTLVMNRLMSTKSLTPISLSSSEKIILTRI